MAVSFHPLAWWHNLSAETKRLIVYVAVSLPSAVSGTLGSINLIAALRGNEKPRYGGLSIPIVMVKDDTFIREAREKLKPYNAQTQVVIDNGTSQQMSQVVVLIPRNEGYSSLTDNKGNFTTPAPFEGRVEVPPIPPLASRFVTVWHKELLRPGEQVIISSKEYGKSTETIERDESSVNRIYAWGFWIASVTVIILLLLQFFWWHRRKKPGQVE